MRHFDNVEKYHIKSLGDMVESIFDSRLKAISKQENFEKAVEMMKDFLNACDDFNMDYSYTIDNDIVLKGYRFYIEPDLYEDEIEEGMHIEYMDDINKHAFYDENGNFCFLEAEL